MNDRTKPVMRILRTIVGCGLVACLVFEFGFSASNGFGLAINGKIQDGRFYLDAHGNTIEVSRTTFVVSGAGTGIFALLLLLLCLLPSEEQKPVHWGWRLVGMCLAGVVAGCLMLKSILCIIKALQVG